MIAAAAAAAAVTAAAAVAAAAAIAAAAVVAASSVVAAAAAAVLPAAISTAAACEERECHNAAVSRARRPALGMRWERLRNRRWEVTVAIATTPTVRASVIAHDQ